MKKNSFILIMIFCLCSCYKTFAQTSPITIEQAIEIGLKNNYDILLSKNISQQAVNNNTLGNAGMLPTITLNASGVSAKNDTKQEFASAPTVDKKGVSSQNLTTGAYLTWTVFDGLKMFATHERLNQLENIGLLTTKIQIENTLVNLMSSYYNVVMQKQMIKALKENISVSEERLKIAQKKYEIGTSSKLDVLQAKIDLNAQKSSLIRANTLLSDSKEKLNQLLVVDVEKDFDVTDSIPLMNNYKYEDLKNAIASKNSDLLVAQKSMEVSNYMIKEAKAAYYPKLNLNANYIFSRAENQAGFTLLNQNLGLNLGLTASWTIFNGFINSNNVKNMKLNLEYSNLQFANLKTQLQLEMLKAFKKFTDDMVILNMEDENSKLAKENLTIAMELFRVGKSTSIEIKTAQQSFEDSFNRLSNARYSAKLSEIQLMKLSGGILK